MERSVIMVWQKPMDKMIAVRLTKEPNMKALSSIYTSRYQVANSHAHKK